MTHAFDAAAADYDETFSHRQLGVWLRDLVHQHLPFWAGDHILELGCGTGEDAVWLGQRGVHVTAADASKQMLYQTLSRVQNANLSDIVTTSPLDMNAPQHSNVQGQFDGVLSNFGAFNCVLNRPDFVNWLADHVKPGGQCVFVVMGPLCLWEIGWHLLHGRPRTAFRRLNGRIEAHVGHGESITVEYPSARRLRGEFAPHFRYVKTVSIGTLLPPSYLAHLVERWTGVFRALAGIDRRVAPLFPATLFGDHYLIQFERL